MYYIYNKPSYFAKDYHSTKIILKKKNQHYIEK